MLTNCKRYYEKGKSKPTLVTVQINQQQQNFTFQLSQAPDKITVDPNNKLIAQIL